MKNDIIMKKIIAYAEKIISYCDDKDYETFSNDTMRIEACVFNLSQIGELVRHLDEGFMNLH